MKINIAGLSKGSVLAALYNAATPQGMWSFQARTGDMTEAEAEAILIRTNYIDYCAGRPIKIDFSEDEIDVRFYDRDAGNGAAELAIAPLRKVLAS